MTKANQVILGAGGISAVVIEHSLHPSEQGKPLITIQLRYPRFIHSEFMTHRVFSRNASSSRAIPVAKMIEQVRNEPAMPIHFGKNQPGMQANQELQGDERDLAVHQWKLAAERAADSASILEMIGTHKQVANRILEPFQFISVIVTATEWDNFFELRDHPDAQPEIKELARVMKLAIAESKPRLLHYGEWHLPYVTEQERKYYNVESCKQMSAARCARVSYLTHDGKEPDVGKDFDLFDRLVSSKPLHASPIEHQASPDPYLDFGGFSHPELWGNLRTWVQFRKMWERKFQSNDQE